MSEARRVSRRTSLRSIGAVGAALAVGGPAAATCQAAGASNLADRQEKPAASAPDVAVSRFTKGHS